MDWADLIAKVGFPAAFAFGMGYGLYRVGQWLAPRGDKVVDAHLTFLANLQARDEVQTECLRVLSEETKRHREMVTTHMSACELIHKAKREETA
jgi:hypothetical protein